MDSSTDTPAYAHPSRQPRSPLPSYLCPHCGGVLDMRAGAPHEPATARGQIAEPVSPAPQHPAALLSRLAVSALERCFPLTQALSRGSQMTPPPAHPVPRVPRWVRVALLALPLALALLWLVWQAGVGSRASSAAPTDTSAIPTPPPVTAALDAPPDQTLEHAALLAVIAGYNTAEQHAAATLTLDPVRPFLDPTGPLLQRRSQELAARQARNAAHATRLLRWAVGAIAIDPAGTTATLITQETWNNQESGAVAPQMVTARIVYTLRRSDPHAPWLIYDTARTIL